MNKQPSPLEEQLERILIYDWGDDKLTNKQVIIKIMAAFQAEQIRLLEQLKIDASVAYHGTDDGVNAATELFKKVRGIADEKIAELRGTA